MIVDRKNNMQLVETHRVTSPHFQDQYVHDFHQVIRFSFLHRCPNSPIVWLCECVCLLPSDFAKRFSVSETINNEKNIPFLWRPSRNVHTTEQYGGKYVRFSIDSTSTMIWILYNMWICFRIYLYSTRYVMCLVLRKMLSHEKTHLELSLGYFHPSSTFYLLGSLNFRP